MDGQEAQVRNQGQHVREVLRGCDGTRLVPTNTHTSGAEHHDTTSERERGWAARANALFVRMPAADGHITTHARTHARAHTPVQTHTHAHTSEGEQKSERARKSARVGVIRIGDPSTLMTPRQFAVGAVRESTS